MSLYLAMRSILTPLGFALAVSACRPGTLVLEPVAPEPVLPEPLARTLRTHDRRDAIVLSSVPSTNPLSLVEILFSSARGGWHALGLAGTVLTDGGAVQIEPRPLAVDFWKETTGGVPTHVGEVTLDLSAYAGHVVTLDWVAS